MQGQTLPFSSKAEALDLFPASSPLPESSTFRAVSRTHREQTFSSRTEAVRWLKAQGGGDLFHVSSVPLAFPIDTVLLHTVQTPLALASPS